MLFSEWDEEESVSFSPASFFGCIAEAVPVPFSGIVPLIVSHKTGVFICHAVLIEFGCIEFFTFCFELTDDSDDGFGVVFFYFFAFVCEEEGEGVSVFVHEGEGVDSSEGIVLSLRVFYFFHEVGGDGHGFYFILDAADETSFGVIGFNTDSHVSFTGFHFTDIEGGCGDIGPFRGASK